jgi:hypothetical protein
MRSAFCDQLPRICARIFREFKWPIEPREGDQFLILQMLAGQRPICGFDSLTAD